jgi:DNA recombination protein RmuC
MDLTVYILAILLALVLGILLSTLVYQRRQTQLKENNIELKAALAAEQLRNQERMQDMQRAQEALKETFAALSQDALKHNTGEFLRLAEQNLKHFHQLANSDFDKREQSIEHLIKPIREALNKTEEQVRRMEHDRKEAYGTLTEQVKQMADTQSVLQKETRNLVQAFRRPEIRGQWGELTLRRLAELAGMVEHCDFYEQEHITTEDGPLRPDMVVRLPGEGIIVVDAKTPMDAYLDAVEASDDEQRLTHLKRHARHIRERIKELSQKAYWDQFPTSPEYVVLFVPGEQFLNAALDQERGLHEEALRQKVILASPNNFIAILRTAAAIWRQEKLAAHATEIRLLGEELYSRLATFGEHLGKLGKSLDASVGHYNKAVASYDKRILPGARKFTEMGISSKKEVTALEPVEKLSNPLTSEADKDNDN